jgi:salicylate hydroxylase
MSDPTELRIRNGQFKSIERLDPFAATVWSWVYEHDPVAAAREPVRRPAEEVLDREGSRRAWNLWNGMLTPDDTVKGRQGIRAAFARFHQENFRPLPGTVLEEIAADGVPCLIVRAREEPGGPLLLHFHGGGYMMGSARTSAGLASRISEATGGTCAVLDYRLAPEYPFPAALHDAVAAYSWFVRSGTDPAQMVFVGEAAGAGLAIATAMTLRDQGARLPGAIVAMSPFVDLSVTGESIDARGDLEPISRRKLLVQMAAAYLQGHDPEDPLASPIFGELDGLPPMLIQVAEKEALLSDAERLAQRAREDGAVVDVESYADTVHLFPMFDFLPESDDALASVAAFVQSHVRTPVPD